MPSFATINITGHITQPEQKYTAKGVGIASFSIPVNEREFRDGAWQESSVTWWRCSAFGNAAERVMKLDKGALVNVVGRVKSRPWTDREGVEKISLEVTVSEFNSLGSQPRQTVAPVSGGAGDEYSDALPF